MIFIYKSTNCGVMPMCKEQNYFENIFNSNPNALIIIDREYIIQGFNKAAANTAKNILNRSLTIGQPIFDCFIEEHTQSIKESLDHALQGNSVENEHEISGLNHINYWFELNYSPILSDTEEITGVFISAKAIKKRKIIEEVKNHRLAFEQLVSKISSRFISFSDINQAINVSLEDIGNFCAASRSYIFLFSDNQKIMDNTHEWCGDGVSPQIENLKGLPSNIFPWWMEKLHKGEIILIKDISQLTPEASCEKEILAAQGIVSVVILPIYVQYKLFGFIGFDNIREASVWQREDLSLLKLTSEIFSNAFERLQAEQALKTSERKFRELFHNVNDIICVHTLEEANQKTRFIEVNDFACYKTGYSREEYFTMTPADLCTPDFAAYFPTLQEEISKSGHITYEMEYLTKEGIKVPLEMNSHLFSLNGEQVVMTIGRDITEGLRMEKELKQNNADLQNALNTIKETQSRLIQQEQLAGIGQLAAGIAHEINNPLAFIISNCGTLQKYLQLLMSSFDKYRDFSIDLHKSRLPHNLNAMLIEIEKQYASGDIIQDLDEILGDIREGLQRVDNIVKGLSAFSRIDQQKQLKDMDLHAGITNTLIVAANEYKYYAEIEKSLMPIPLIKGIAGQINQVLLNILLNAVYAIRDRSLPQKGLIKIATYHDACFVYCEIEDNGTGIPEESLGKIFIPFFTTKPVGEGTGLGLSIVYDIIVNKHGGEVNVESTLNEGTKFILKFPLNY